MRHKNISNPRYFAQMVSGLLVAALLLISSAAFAQADIQREVRVVKPYSPTLSDADKINILPDMQDTVRLVPAFNYTITPKRFSTGYQVERIQPARMVGLPLERLYKSQLTLGMGNYMTPIGELTINQLRSRKSAMGLYLKHHSSGGKVKLDNDERVFSGFSDNQLNLHGKYFFRNSVIEGGLGGDYKRIHYYGYNPSITDTVLEKEEIRQWFYTLGSDLRYYSSHSDSFRLSYNIGVDYRFMMDAYDHSEHAISAANDFGRLFGDQYVGLHLGFAHYATSSSIDTLNNTVLEINPFISKKGDEWMFLVGVNTNFDINGNDPDFKMYPKAAFEFHIVKDVLIPYIGVDGHRQVNNYRSILGENPFIVPGLKVKNSNYTITGQAGIRGRYSSKMAFNFRGTYAMVDNMHFFLNDTSQVLGNQFGVEYDDARISGLQADISWNHNEKLKFLLKANAYSYELNNLSHPWHKPLLEVGLGASYNLRDKILVDMDIFYTGNRYAPSPDPIGEPILLKAFPDANLNVEYRYNRLLSFFLRFHNFTASRYQIWNQYPVQRFQAIGGFSYAL